jgi:hypothetical protein
MIIALGTAWVLDGIAITIAGEVLLAAWPGGCV